MFVSEDGTVTGSIDVSKLDEVEAKTDEAKAQIEALKAERDAGQKLADADADRVAEVHAAQAAQLTGEPAKVEAPKAPATKSAPKSASSSDKG
ncbi:MAG TPA: hypothetical protein VGJ86_13515 [Acidimicrobiales bacterium]